MSKLSTHAIIWDADSTGSWDETGVIEKGHKELIRKTLTPSVDRKDVHLYVGVY